MHFTEDDIAEVQAKWQRLRRRPSRDETQIILAGVLDYTMEPAGLPALTDEFQIRLHVSMDSAGLLPKVHEDGGRIPHEIDHHTFSDGALCLGSPLRLKKIIGSPPSLLRFVNECLVPFLYAVTWREQGGSGYPFGELAHGSEGLVSDYEDLFGVKGRSNVVAVLRMLALRKREANKLACPCGCGLRLGRCKFHHSLAPWRRLSPRKFYAALMSSVAEQEGAL